MTSDTADRMRDAAVRWLERLDDDQLRAALQPFGADARCNWGYVPGERDGVALYDMTRTQAKAAFELLATGLSSHAFAQAATIVGFEDVLDAMEGGRRNRHRGDYWVVVFGDPSGPELWSWRFEGHHVSVTHTILEGEAVRGTPVFLGSNPACLTRMGRTVREAGRRPADGLGVVLEPLGAEEHLGFALLDALGAEQRRLAVISEEPPSDILTGDEPEVREPDITSDDRPGGIGVGELVGNAGDLARRLVDLYLDRVPGDLAAALRGRVDVDEVRFAWAGGNRPGQPHYYRLVGPRLLIELDNTQNDANHVHSVLRDPRGDFGGDLLRDHLAAAPSRFHG